MSTEKDKRIWLSLAKMGGAEMGYIQEAFDTNWVVPLGPNVTGFEKALAETLGGGKYVVALSAGTAALHLGLLLLGVGPGDEVLCQSFTFAASANPIAYLGARPVFVESEPETWNMSPAWLEEAIRARKQATGRMPKAMVGVNLYGMPAAWDELLAVCEKYGIPVLEDAAESLGSVYRGRKCGTLGRFGVLSFNGNKIITTSGGGALVCPDEATANRALFYATQAREAAPHYQHEKIGYNYRLSNVCAGIGRGQLRMLPEFLARRRANHAFYAARLAGVRGVRVFEGPGGDVESNFWLTTVRIDPVEAGFTREDARRALDAANIEARPLWKPMHLQPVFREAPFYGDGTSESLFDCGLCLPSGAGLEDAELERVCAVLEGLARA